MLFVFFLLWVIFNGKFTLEIALFGIVISLAVYAFICKFMDWSPKRDLYIIKISGFLIQYAFVLLKEIFKANVAPSIRFDSVKECIRPMNIEKAKAPNMPVPGVGGMVYPKLGLGNIHEKNKYTPNLVLARLHNS
mgnify:CR=1 FL=1